MSKDMKARIFAIKAHDGQRRDGGEPYINHPAQVASIVALITPDEELVAAAWLHDVLEDTDVSYLDLEEEFGTRIADLVHEVTHELHPKGNYFPRLKSRDAILIKFADRLSNLSDMNAWDEKRQAHYLKKSKFWKSEAGS